MSKAVDSVNRGLKEAVAYAEGKTDRSAMGGKASREQVKELHGARKGFEAVLETIFAGRRREPGINIGFDSGRRLGQELAFTHGLHIGRGRGVEL